MAVLIETSQGDIVIDLYTEERPKSSFNFLKLCKVKYYNFCLVHTVQRHTIIQTGDPTGEGEGGECIWGVIKGEDYRFFEAETTPRLKHEKVGLVSMVNNGHDHHGSQFVITTGENLDYLDGKHTVFGEVAEGWDVLMKINEAYCDKEGRPYQDIRIYHTVVLEDPYDDPEGIVLPDRSPSPPKVVTDSNRIGAEEDVDDFKGKSEGEVREIVGKREMKANAQILEMVGDIPDAEGKPPENVLFVCKLNQATTAEDLEIIFSRFGPILSCEVIKDQKTGDSLQYAFIEFENEEDCINGYFKMDNVLIDDRRIHVDFSQSLAKVKGIRKRKYSEEKHGDAHEGDGFVSKQPSAGGEAQYEMLFDETEVAKSYGKKKTKQESSDSETRPKERDREKRRKDERRERGRNDERRGRDERRERERGDHERRSHHSGSRDGERSRGWRREEESRHKHRRSRSHSRERYHKQSRDRSRSHSGERRNRH